MNILLNIAAASIIAIYQDTLSAVIALAVFLPIISDMSGCSGNQAVAVSIRELSLGVIRPFEMARVYHCVVPFAPRISTRRVTIKISTYKCGNCWFLQFLLFNHCLNVVDLIILLLIYR